MPRGQGANTPLRHMRIEDEIWDPFTEATRRQDSNNSQTTREFMAWFARVPGAKLPERPKVERTTTDE